MAGSNRESKKHIFKEPVKPVLRSFDSAKFAQWVDAVADYTRALNNMNWFATPADEREGRLFLEEIPGASPELEQAQIVLNNLFANNGSVPYLIEAFESCIKLSFSGWNAVLKSLHHHKLDNLKSISPPEFKNKVYFFMGRHIADAFCNPIKQSEKWSLFLKELSQKTYELVSSQISDNVDKLVQQQVNALEELILGAAVYCLLKKWNDHYVPKAEEGTPEGRISREKQRVLYVLMSPLSATFHDSSVFLEQLFLEYMNKKISIPLLALRIGITTEIDDRLLKYVHKGEDLTHIQQLKRRLKNELDEKLKEKFKDRDATSLGSEVDDSHSSSTVISLPVSAGRSRAMSMPPILGVKPFLLSESPMFRLRQASVSDKKDESNIEPIADLKL